MKTELIAIAAALAVGWTGPALAQEAAVGAEVQAEAEAEGPIRVIRAEDASLRCPQISEEAAQLSQAMGGEPDGGVFGDLGGVARSGAAMLIPGAGLLMAGADALAKPERDRREAEALAVQNRWFYLNGLYSGRRCQERAEAAGPVAPGTPAPAE